nr:MAG TPA: hypothetical protein [Bacteriophage sp.]
MFHIATTHTFNRRVRLQLAYIHQLTDDNIAVDKKHRYR